MKIARRSLLAVAAAATVVRHGRAAEQAAAPFSVIAPTLAMALRATPPAVANPVLRRAAAALDRPPQAVARFHVEGGYAGKPEYDAGQVAQRELALIRDVALAWRLSGERRFLDAAARYLEAWSAAYAVSLNPIDEESFERVMIAADLVRGDLPAPVRVAVDGFVARFAAGYLDFIEASTRRTSLRATDRNNWNSHRVKIAVLAAYAGGDGATIGRARAAFDLQLARNVKPGGEVMDFAERDALHYVVYSLLPLGTACAAAAAHGESWLTRAPTGAGNVRAGIEWLLPYVAGEKTHQEFVRSTVRFDAERAAAGVAGFTGPWKRESALDLIALAAHLDPAAYRPAYERLTRDTGRQAADWMRILFPA